MAARGRASDALIGVARHTETETLYTLTAAAGTIVATPGASSDDTWLSDARALAATDAAWAGSRRHFKGGRYEFVARAREATTGDSLVIYTSSDGRVWARPEQMVQEPVEHEGRLQPRFRRES